MSFSNCSFFKNKDFKLKFFDKEIWNLLPTWMSCVFFFQSRHNEGGRLYRAEPCFSNKSGDGHPVPEPRSFSKYPPPPPLPAPKHCWASLPGLRTSSPFQRKLDRWFPYLTPVNAFRYWKKWLPGFLETPRSHFYLRRQDIHPPLFHLL